MHIKVLGPMTKQCELLLQNDEKVVAGGSVLPVEEIMEIIRHLN